MTTVPIAGPAAAPTTIQLDDATRNLATPWKYARKRPADNVITDKGSQKVREAAMARLGEQPKSKRHHRSPLVEIRVFDYDGEDLFDQEP